MMKELLAKPHTLAPPNSRLLLVEDEPAVAGAYAHTLMGRGLHVEVAFDGEAGLEMIDATEFDAVVSDVALPAMDGMDFVRLARLRRPELAVIMMTALPTLEGAMKCVELGAFRYLVKPIPANDLCSAAIQAVRVAREARAQRQLLADYERISADYERMNGQRDTHALARTFAGAIEKLFMVAQPLVSVSERRIVAYEALVRSSDSAMPHPGALFEAADRLEAHEQIGRATRQAIARDIAPRLPDGTLAFINVHPTDLLDESLYDEHGPLASLAPRAVLELTERGSLDLVPDLAERVARLRGLGFRIAIDDLGAGYAGLTTFARVQPEVAKLDMSLVRDVHREPTKRRLIQSMGSFCKDMGILLVCEGVETADERDVLLDLGCDLQQGYLYARPAAPFTAVEW